MKDLVNIKFINIPFNANGVSRQALPENKNRRYLLIQNNSVATIYIGFTNKVTLESGIRIIPTGFYEPYGITSSSVHIMTTGAQANSIVIMEGIGNAD